MAVDAAGIRDLSESLIVYNWELIFSSIPGGTDTYPFSIQARNLMIPGASLESWSSRFKTTQVTHHGAIIINDRLVVEYEEVRNAYIYKALWTWMNMVSNVKTGLRSGNTKTSATARLLDGTNEPSLTFLFHEVEIESLPPFNLSDAADSVRLSPTFSVDYFTLVD